jgi:excisionase family DNA binding protein
MRTDNTPALAVTLVPRLLSLRAVAEQTSIPRPTWYTLVARGEIPATRIGRTVRIDERDLLAFLAARRG